MGRPDYFGQFRETARCGDAQHGDGVCCAFAPLLVLLVQVTVNILLLREKPVRVNMNPSIETRTRARTHTPVNVIVNEALHV